MMMIASLLRKNYQVKKAFLSSSSCLKRHSSTQNNDESNKESSMSHKAKSAYELYKPKIIQGGSLVGGGIVLYGVSRLFYDITLSFLSLTPAVSLKYGFIGGLLSGGATVALGFLGDKALNARADRALEAGLHIAQNSQSLF